MAPPENFPTEPELTAVKTEQCQCLVATEWAASLRELLRRDPAEWTDWEDIKTSTVRTIFRGQLLGPDGARVDVYLKLFRAVRLSDRARDALTGSRSAREQRNLLEARRRGLPCITPIAAGTYSGSFGSRSFLVTLAEPGEPLPRGPLAATDATAAGELLRRAHDAGLHARDLHSGNVLRGNDGVLRLLDLTSAAFADPLTAKDRGLGLAFFCLDLDAGVRDPAARAVLRGYGPDDAVLSSAEQAGRRLRNRALSAFGRRAFRPCRTTATERRRRKPRRFLHVPEQELWDAARARMAEVETLEPFKSGRRGAVYLTDTLVLKTRTAAHARRLFEAAYWLQFAKIPAPAPVALETFRSLGVVAMRRLPFDNLHDELHSDAGLTAAERLRAAVSLGNSIARLHSFGLRNRDLKFENLVRDPGTGVVAMVDLDGIQRRHPTDGRGRAGDLGRLLAAFLESGAPGGDEVRRAFLRTYVRTCRQLLYPVPHRRHVFAQAEIRAGAKLAARG